jgi:tetratricopeptide (TPR) repeat protein
MDAPSAREAGAFNWGATAWHELAHTFTLGVTNDRVPRWLSEGLSVLEERRAMPGWGDGATPQFLQAWKQGRVPTLAKLNDGFVRPQFPQQVIFSYYAASLACEMIERDHGVAGLTRLLAAYKEGLETPAAVRRALGVGLDTLSARFSAYVDRKFGAALESAVSPGGGAFGRALAEGDSLLAANDTTRAIAALERAKGIFPDYAGEDGPYARLAKLYEARGDLRRAAVEMDSLTARNGTSYGALVALADLRERLRDSAGVVGALERAIWISPYDPAIHQRLATVAAALRDHRRAVRERRAVLALAPVDLADARYQLARALYDAGDRGEAKRELLRALEQAPSYAPAQDLLLQLVDGAAAPGAGR